MKKVFIIGAGGMVGASAAYAIAIREIAREIILIDIAEDLVEGQAMDINHATAYTNGVHVRTGDYSEIEENDLVVITSGAAQKPGQTRLELVEINTKIIKDVISKVMQSGKQVYILVVANPVDVLTYVALKESGLSKERVFGTGTTLDTARLRVILSQKLNVSQRHVHGYILGEHGDSSFPALSALNIAGIDIHNFPGFSADIIANIEKEIRESAYKIIEAKKSTYYGIGNVVASIVESHKKDNKNILPVCSLLEGEYGLFDTVLGVPTMVTSRGVKIIDHYPLTDEEQEKLRRSAEIIKEVIRSLGY
jgi:L-lactate dehydrogenase